MDSHSISTIIDIDPSEFTINSESIESFALEVCQALGIAGYELCIRMVTSDEIQNANREFRQIDRPTDVLSFPQVEWNKARLAQFPAPMPPKKNSLAPPDTLGDILLCLEVAQTNALDIGQSLGEEVCFLLVHGILHLCGHDHIHTEDEAVMIAQQQQLMTHLKNQQLWPTWATCVRAGDNRHV